jgi:hypothetical protein
MKFARGLRQLGLDHILWGHRVVRVECAHRIRIVRDVQKVLDLGNNGGIDFGHIRFEVRGRVVEVFLEDELVVAALLGCCVAHHLARDIESLCEGWRSRSMIPAQRLERAPATAGLFFVHESQLGASEEREKAKARRGALAKPIDATVEPMRETLESGLPDTAPSKEWLGMVGSVVVPVLICAVLFAGGILT